MNQRISESQLPQDEDALLALIRSASIELARFQPKSVDHQLTEEGLDIMRKVLFDVRNRNHAKRSRSQKGRSR